MGGAQEDRRLNYLGVISLAEALESLIDDLEPGPWIEIGQPGAPPFQNGWGPGGVGGNAPAYRIVTLIGGGETIQLAGQMTGGAIGTVAWTMPAEARPSNLVAMGCASYGPPADVAGFVQVDGAGDVRPMVGATSIALEGCSYYR